MFFSNQRYFFSNQRYLPYKALVQPGAWGWHFSGQRSWNSAKKNRSMAIQNLRENWTWLVKKLEFWLVVFRHPSEIWWSESQLGVFFPIYGKIKNVWNHQPVGVWWVFSRNWTTPPATNLPHPLGPDIPHRSPSGERHVCMALLRFVPGRKNHGLIG